MVNRRVIPHKVLSLTLAFSALVGVGFAQDGPQVPEPALELRPACTPPTYLSPPNPDTIANLLKARKRYRLVIGAGEFLDQPKINNRTYVEPTAVLVDQALAEIGFDALPSLKSGQPYLIGKGATRSAITAALKEMAAVTQGQDFGIVYYVGHGSIAPSGSDLSLAIYDEPVASDQGYRVSDIFGVLQTSIYRTAITQIPHLFVIIDACFSGTVAQQTQPVIVTMGGVQHLAEIAGGGPVIPAQVAVLTSTSAGASSSAYELHGSGRSAFGYYFARALKEDWACSDSLARDGILTLEEINEYLRDRLQLASDKGAVDALMIPRMLARDKDALLAYRADKYVEPGFRRLISNLLIQPQADQVVDLTLPGNAQVTCSDSTNGCTIPVSLASLNSPVTVRVTSKQGGYKALTGELPSEKTKTIKWGDLTKNTPKTVFGAKLSASQATASQ
jgi:hypothetical protein